MSKFLLLLLPLLLIADELYYYSYGKKVYLSPQQNAPSRLDSASLHVKDSYHRVYSIKNSVIFQLKAGVDIASITSTYGLVSLKTLGQQLFTCKTKYANDAITLANRLYESGHVVFAMPNIVQKRQRR